MKTRVLFNILMLLVFFSTTNYNYAQKKGVAVSGQYAGKSTKFAVMVGDVLHFRAAIQTAEELQSKKNKYDFEIIIVGELAKIITEDKSLIKDFDQSERLGIKLVVCENALIYFNVDKSKLDKRLLLTKNSWIYMFELKDKGFNTLNV